MKNKTIVITGGTTGIGFATAQLLLSEGAKVIVTGRNPETLAQARQALSGATVLSSDAGDLSQAQQLGEEVKKHASHVDGVFLNAGVGQFGPIEAMTPQHYDLMFNINVRGLYFQLQSLLPLLHNPSSVVFNASVAGLLAMNGTSLYSATKAAVASFGRTLSVDLAPRGIRVNTVSPGPVATPIFGKLELPREVVSEFEKNMAASTLFKRIGQPADVAKLVRFLLSADSDFIVGEEIVIDGGVQHT